MLKFSAANVKIKLLKLVTALVRFLPKGMKVYSFDLLSGHSCPMADKCLSKVVIKDGKRKIQDGKNTEFRCFSASQEALFPLVYALRKANFDALKRLSTEQMVNKIMKMLPADLGVLRIHVAGDFFNKKYFQAWLQVARENPTKLFYAYTKSLDFWIDAYDHIPENLVLTASYGGRHDHLIKKHGLRFAQVVFSEQEAADLNLEIDHDDSHAANPETRFKSFALLLHGQQPAGSDASSAIKELKKNKVNFSYSDKKDKKRKGK